MKYTAYNTALNYLARRDHSLLELRQKLQQKDFDANDIDAAVQKLCQSNLQSDYRFAENYTKSRRRKGYGPQRISLELKEKGIPPEMIAEVLEIADNSWFSDIFQVWKKRFKGIQPKDFKERARQMRFLQYRGFTTEQISTVFQKDEN
jgi:regulatory protein